MSVQMPIGGVRRVRSEWVANYASTANTVAYLPIGGTAGANGTENTRHTIVTRPVRITRIYVGVSVNARTGQTVVGLRDDGATIASVTIPATTTYTSSLLDSGVLDVVIAAGSKVNFIVDPSAVADTNSLTVSTINVELEYL